MDSLRPGMAEQDACEALDPAEKRHREEGRTGPEAIHSPSPSPRSQPEVGAPERSPHRTPSTGGGGIVRGFSTASSDPPARRIDGDEGELGSLRSRTPEGWQPAEALLSTTDHNNR